MGTGALARSSTPAHAHPLEQRAPESGAQSATQRSRQQHSCPRAAVPAPPRVLQRIRIGSARASLGWHWFDLGSPEHNELIPPPHHPTSMSMSKNWSAYPRTDERGS